MDPCRGFCSIFAHSLFENRSMLHFPIRNGAHAMISTGQNAFPYWKTAIFMNIAPMVLIPYWKSDQWPIFKEKSGGYQSWDRNWNRSWDRIWAIIGPRAGRPGGRLSVPYPMAGKIFIPTPPHTHTDHTIDFINPDCHLLGKKKTAHFWWNIY